MDFSNLIINRVIIHEIFKRNIEKQLVDPKYSNTLSELDEGGMEVLEERIINAIGSNSHSMEMEIIDQKEGSCVSIVNRLLNSEDNHEFAIISQEIAYKLTESQISRRIPGGIVLIFDATIGLDSKRAVGIIKAEIHSGFTRESTSRDVVLKYLSELLLTPQQKLYKIALFIESDLDDSLDLVQRFSPYVYDHNMKKSETKDAATYFYNLFLGCTFKSNSKIITRDFYENTREFINKLEISDEEKFDLNMELYSYAKSPINTTIGIEDFANNSLDAEIRDTYETFMKEKNIPETLIQKDTQYIESRLKQRKIKFSNDVSIIGPSEKFKDLVQVISEEDNVTMLMIKGKISDQQ